LPTKKSLEPITQDFSLSYVKNESVHYYNAVYRNSTPQTTL